MGQKIVQVDAFTDTPFRGNPAAVCIMSAPCADDAWMQAVAAEMNLSETAFGWAVGDVFSLRWFTPIVEIDLCGHATVATAHVLWQDGLVPPTETIRFQTRSGLLTAERRGELVELDFPATPPAPVEPPEGLEQALGVEALWTGRSRSDYLVEVESADTVRQLRPDFGVLARLPVRGVMVTSRADSDRFDFVSRFFAPAVGVPEDPVTGSAHCALAPFWGERLNKTEMVGYQASARGGVVGVGLAGDRVKLRGAAVTVFRGELA
ncbi:MAG TPA: PhzF family phenazine biosynthesis protein [Tepidiformaceae bacterium]